jgi:hypothetical protein
MTPVVNKEYMGKEIPDMSLVFQDWTVWGIKAIVVRVAAIKPR